MPIPFNKTLSFLDAQSQRRTGLVMIVASVVVVVWGGWLAGSTTTVYAVSDEGRLLANGAASPIQTSVAGVVSENKLTLGAEVTAGAVLVELDSSAEKLRRGEEEIRKQGLEETVRNLELIIEAERGLAQATTKAGATRVSSAAAKANAAATVAALAKQQDEAIRRLRDASLVSNLDALKAAEDLQRQRGQLTINSAETALAAADFDRVRKETGVRLLTLQKELSELKTNVLAAASVITQLDFEIAKRKLRAPVDGTIADVVPLPVGAAVGANHTLATIVPKTKMRWVAYFPIRDAVGRIHPGQHARIRLDAFPWTAYGPLNATVAGVGSEPHDQRVRVELDVAGDNTNIPLSHGMTGVTDVEVERMSPLRLLLRLSGQTIQGNKQRAPAAASSASPVRDRP
jgi:membrane fusion protein (multidrug efflux system)